MKRMMLELTDALAAVLDRARGDRHLGPCIEAWLWRMREVRDAARELGVVRPERRGRGRPKNAQPKEP